MPRLTQNSTKLSDCDFSAVHQCPKTYSEILEYYNTIRAYLTHEDDLINSRLTWSLTVHGFLLAAFGLLLSKSTDLFAEFDRTAALANPTMHGIEIAFLCFAQALVAGLGSFIGITSYRAIRAAHVAIQHIHTIAHSGPLLATEVEETNLTREVGAGIATAQPGSMENILPGTHVAVGSPEGRYEVVKVISVSGPEFDARFEHHHPAATKVRPLGWGLLPKVIAGGDRGLHTGPARTYYLGLPLAASGLWACLLFFSVVLGIIAGLPCLRESVLAVGKLPQPSTQPTRSTDDRIFP